jgi:hypothetical protein
VAFFADFDSGPFGIFAGPDVVADTVTGDVLFGSAVKTLSFEEPGGGARGQTTIIPSYRINRGLSLVSPQSRGA